MDNNHIPNSADNLNSLLKKNYEGYRSFVKNLTKSVPMVNSAVSSVFAFYDQVLGLKGKETHESCEQACSPSCSAEESGKQAAKPSQEYHSANPHKDKNLTSKKPLKSKLKK